MFFTSYVLQILLEITPSDCEREIGGHEHEFYEIWQTIDF